MAYDPEAVYNQTIADLGLQAGWEEGGLTEQDTNLKANSEAAEGGITREEPGVYRGESNASNRGGILTSGINAHRKEGIASSFAERRANNQRARLEGENSIKRQREGGQLKRTERQHEAEGTRAREKDRIAGEEAANAQATSATQSAAPPANNGGVVPKESQQGPGAWYRVGPAKAPIVPRVASQRAQRSTRSR